MTMHGPLNVKKTCIYVTCKRYRYPITALERPREFQEVGAPRFQDSRHTKVVRLSAVCTGRLNPPGNIPGTHIH